MSWRSTIAPYHDYLFLVGWALAIFGVWDKLPETLPLMEDKAPWAYTALFAFLAYVAWSSRRPAVANAAFARTVPVHNVSDPHHLQDIARQRGPVMRSARPPVIPSGGVSPRPDDKTFETFRRD